MRPGPPLSFERKQRTTLKWSTDRDKDPTVRLVYQVTVRSRAGKVTSVKVCDSP
jgi:hypothetical protein